MVTYIEELKAVWRNNLRGRMGDSVRDPRIPVVRGSGRLRWNAPRTQERQEMRRMTHMGSSRSSLANINGVTKLVGVARANI